MRHKILVLFAHPTLEKSRVHKKMTELVKEVEGVTFHDLYETYPNFQIDVPKEQELLTEHDIIILQHPFYWYSCPPLMKQWIDLVLEHGWAYGSKGTKLAGKWGLNAISTGGPERAYTTEGMNKHTISEYLLPFWQTFNLCKMIPLPPFVVYGTHSLDAEAIEKHAKNYVQFVESLLEKFEVCPEKFKV